MKNLITNIIIIVFFTSFQLLDPIDVRILKVVTAEKKCNTYYLNYISINNNTEDTIFIFSLSDICKSEIIFNKFLSDNKGKVLNPCFYTSNNERLNEPSSLYWLKEDPYLYDCSDNLIYTEFLKREIKFSTINFNKIESYKIAPHTTQIIDFQSILRNKDAKANELKKNYIIYYTKNEFKLLQF